MPLILPSNTISAGGYEVANSLRFDDGSSDYLVRSLGSQSSLRIGTFSFWIKFSQITVNRQIYSNEVENDNNRGYIQFTNTDELRIVDNDISGDHIVLKTNAKYRDISAFYNFVIRIDTTQSTSTDRVRLYVNGIQETSFSSTTYPAQNDDLKIFEGGQTNKNLLGSGYPVGGSYIDGYISEFVYCDGQSLDPTSFGEFDEDTGIWKPIDVSGLTFGNNGFYLDFENSGSLGADVSGNGNNFTTNGTPIQNIDTPTNVFCTLNPLQLPFVTGTTFSLGNTKVAGNNADWQRVYGTIGATTGKWFYEFKNLQNNGYTGECRIGWDSIDFINYGTDNYYSGLTIDRAGKLRGGINGVSGYSPNEVQMTADYSGGNFSFTNGDILGMAIDLDNETFSVYKNGNLEIDAYSYAGLSNNSISKSRGYFIAPSYNWYSSSSDNNRSCFNFGHGYFENTFVSSAQTPDNGYGVFEYSVPSGYNAFCTKSLAEFG